MVVAAQGNFGNWAGRCFGGEFRSYEMGTFCRNVIEFVVVGEVSSSGTRILKNGICETYKTCYLGFDVSGMIW